ncbi:MAG: glutamate---cysteine ligase / carboxylate-amine ligase [Pseudonocardiales bacterium]|jgi:glutamate---cysteine ligase / carboxylate-amine ligase|nr:glutamate---cysteine ligase / carboxylate-amine ligase [Pseudonocardiales bacterium]
MADLVSRIGVEEEFHLVDLQTRRASPAIDAMLDQLDGDSFAPELQRSLVEANTLPCESLDELRGELCRLRRRLNEVAEPLGLGVVSAGTVPLVDLLGTDISAGARYERMQHDYQLLVREQHICGAQVHVDVPDRDVAVAVVQHVALHLPTFLALSSSSPYWRGTDSGYASYRCMVWQRWPTAGPPGPMRTAAEYEAMVADLVASGTISDPGMVYFDIRPSAHLPTVELRICDACPAVDDVVLIAGLFRALVARARRWVEEGRPFPQTRHELLRAATWRAARSGLEGDLVDLANPAGPALVPPSVLVERLVSELRPELDESGDWKQVFELSQRALAVGSSAARQRRMFGQRGELTDVVDGLLALTRGDSLRQDPPTAVPAAPALLDGYRCAGYDEAVGADGAVLPHYGWMFRMLDRLGARGMTAAVSALRTEQRARGVTFQVADDEPDRLFPLDLVPRIITAEDWATLTPGLIQRVRALEAFLHDMYGPQEAIRDGVLPASVVTGSPGWSRFGTLPGRLTVRAAVSGIDLVRDSARGWVVLEDNLRVPSGIGYAMIGRRLVRSVLPDLEPPAGVVPLEGVPDLLRKTLQAANITGDCIALLSAGPIDAAFYEHRLLAEQMDVPLVTPSDLTVTDSGVYAHGRRIGVLYRRLDEQTLHDATGADGRPVGPAICAAVADGRVSLLNALGNGVADDKRVYAYVPDMINYYLDEQVLLDNVPTYPCTEPHHLAEVLDRLDELVLKPVDGYGGHGVVIGPAADRAELAELANTVAAHPEQWVAQELVSLSTHPTFAGTRLEPRAVDLRAFVLLGDRAEVAPAALTRVASCGSMIVNSSRGGGAKDTWILR